MLRVLLLATALLPWVTATAAMQPARDEPGLSGYVLAPDGTPVSSGTVVIQSFGARTISSIDDTGHFRVVPTSPGLYEIAVRVPGLAPYRASVAVPRSRTVKLPIVRLSPATYFRVRFVTSEGEPITSPRLRRQSFDANGPISIPLNDPASGSPERIDGDGTITVGPLPRGLTTFALDTPPLAQTRLPDVSVTGEQPLIDGGTIIIQPGAVLHVDVVDQTGAPVAQHEVFVDDVRPLSSLAIAPVRTNQEGRATFERLAGGRYRVRTTATARCGNTLLSIAPVVPVPRTGTVRVRLIAAGRATFRVTSPLGPLRGLQVSASPEAGSPAPPTALRPRPGASPFFARPARDAACGGATDADGRVTLSTFPPGPARVEVRLNNSSYSRRVEVPSDGREIAMVLAEGFLPVRVLNAQKHDPIVGAAISWTSEGWRVEATASVVGEALVEGLGFGAGTLAVAAPGYKSIEEKLAEPPAVLHDVVLETTPPRNLDVRVVTTAGQPLPDAILELISLDPMEIPRIAVTDPRGAVTFIDAPPGSLRLTASAEGFAAAALSVAADRRTGIVLTLTRESQ